jgi:hypothetical protein
VCTRIVCEVGTEACGPDVRGVVEHFGPTSGTRMCRSGATATRCLATTKLPVLYRMAPRLGVRGVGGGKMEDNAPAGALAVPISACLGSNFVCFTGSLGHLRWALPLRPHQHVPGVIPGSHCRVENHKLEKTTFCWSMLYKEKKIKKLILKMFPTRRAVL